MKLVSGWGRIGAERCRVLQPRTKQQVDTVLDDPALASCVIPRGLGRSYGDPAVNAGFGVVMMAGLNRMLAFDPETMELDCEAGVSLGEILQYFVPRGYFLPVVPGTKFVTLGGAIANDIHGKNHHQDGAFSNFVREMHILLADGQIVRCSPDEKADLFWATVGGIGLTGIILTVRVQLMRISSAYVAVDYQYFRDLEEGLALMAASDKDYTYSVAWVDCLARGKHLGRGILMRGNHAPVADLPPKHQQSPFKVKTRSRNLPVDFPNWALNALSVKAFNTLYALRNRMKDRVYEPYESFFFPLDGIHNWNRMYGKQGFGQYQAAFPFESVDGLVKLFEKLSASRRASFLAVLKCFGTAGNGLLSYPFPGFTLALDLPNRNNLCGFMQELDKILLDYGGRIYTAKDFSAKPETFAAMYPELERFKEIKAQYDPECRFQSNMSRRLGITPNEEAS